MDKFWQFFCIEPSSFWQAGISPNLAMKIVDALSMPGEVEGGDGGGGGEQGKCVGAGGHDGQEEEPILSADNLLLILFSCNN